MKFRLALLITVMVPAPVLANYCAAPLSRVNATINGVVNTYYPVTRDIGLGPVRTIQVGGAFGASEDLRVGDIVLLWIPQTMQMILPSTQNTTSPTQFADGVTGTGWTDVNHSGKFQWLRVAGTNGSSSPPGTVVKAAGNSGTTVITISDGGGVGPFGQLQISAETSNITTLRSAQLVRVPQYGNVTISGTVTALPFQQTVSSGTLGPLAVGGIVALDVAGATIFNPGSKIDVSGLGFRGGAGQKFDGWAASGINLVSSSQWYANSVTTGATPRTTGGIKGEGGVGTPHRLYFQGAETADLNYTGTGTVSREGYGISTPAAYGRGAPGNAGGGATDQCPYFGNPSFTASTQCRAQTGAAVTYAYNRLNTGGGGGAGYGNGGKGGDQDYDGTGGVASPSGGGLGGKGVTFSAFTTGVVPNPSQPPLPGGDHQYAMMGGGGGAGSTNADGTDDLQSSGATGGGVVLIRSGTVSGTGSILADGQDAQNVTATDPANPVGSGAGQGNGAGGGGGGGWILVSARQASSPSITYSAKGGKGGNANKCMGSGGGGGGGYVGTTTTLPAPSGTAVTGGSAGTSSCTLASDLPPATGLAAAGFTSVAPTAAVAGSSGGTGQFAAGSLSVPAGTSNPGNAATTSSSVAPGPQCVPLLKKEFSADGGTTWLASINQSLNQTFKMRITLENSNQDAFLSGTTLPQAFEDISFVDTYPAGIINATPPNVQQSGCSGASITAVAGGNTLTVNPSGAIAGESTCSITADLVVTATGTSTNTIPAEGVSVVQLKQVAGQSPLTLKNFDAVSAQVVVPSGISATKTSAVVSDPVNNTTNPKRIPGASVDYMIAINNPTATVLDNNTMILSDSLPTTTRLFVGNLTGGAPFDFTAGTSNLTCPFVSLSDANDCIDFSDDGGTTWTYTPTAAGDGTDAAIRAVRFRTTGSMAANGNFSIRYRVVVK
jgi:hypothetical protein